MTTITRRKKKEILEQTLAYLEQAKTKLDTLPSYSEITDMITEIEEHLYFDVGELEEQEENLDEEDPSEKEVFYEVPNVRHSIKED